jgi:NAD-dependent SIR2 family protein deacetylase
MLTRSEKLRQKIGHKVECDMCHQKKEFTDNWRMSTDKIIICPECQLKPENRARGMVSI